MKDIIKIDRELIDGVLGDTEDRKQAEETAIDLLGLKNYFDNPKMIKKVTMFILERDMKMIELTARHIKKKYNL